MRRVGWNAGAALRETKAHSKFMRARRYARRFFYGNKEDPEKADPEDGAGVE